MRGFLATGKLLVFFFYSVLPVICGAQDTTHPQALVGKAVQEEARINPSYVGQSKSPSDSSSVPDLWLSSANLNIELFFPHARVFAADLVDRQRNASTQFPSYVVLGRSIDGLGRSFISSLSEKNLHDVLAVDNEGKALFDEYSNSFYLLPSPKLIQAMMMRGIELLTTGGATGLILHLPSYPRSDATVERVLELSGAIYDEKAQSKTRAQLPRNLISAFEISRVAIDRMVSGIRQVHRLKTQSSAQLWLASDSWVSVINKGNIAPLLNLSAGTAPDGVVVSILPLENNLFAPRDDPFHLSNFEWVYFQSATTAAVAERLDCPLVLAIPSEQLSSSHLIDVVVAGSLISAKRAKIMFGWELPASANDASTSSPQNLAGDFLCPSVASALALAIAVKEQPVHVRWDSGSRTVAVAISDGAQFLADRTHALAEILALWLPCVRQGLPARFVALGALGERRIARNLSTLLTSFSFQIPTEKELAALSTWTKRGGTLILFDDGGSHRPFLKEIGDSFRLCDPATSETAQTQLFCLLGLPPVLSEGTYRVGDGWLYYVTSSPMQSFTQQGEMFIRDLINQVADITRIKTIFRSQNVVYRGAYVAGAIGKTIGASRYRLRGTFIDLTTISLPLVRDPLYGTDARFFLRNVSVKAPTPSPSVVAANVLVNISESEHSVGFLLPASQMFCEKSPRLWLSGPRDPFLLVDETTGEAIQYDFPPGTNTLSPNLCRETTSLRFVRMP